MDQSNIEAVEAANLRDTSLGDSHIVRDHKFPVVEIFGGTVQGEGIDQGIPCYFIRFGGCDSKCTWCDSPHAVLPHLVRQAERLTTDEIVKCVLNLTPGPRWVILSGGNPCLHELGNLIEILHEQQYFVAVETQGTRWKDWINWCDRICVSPKPPSSQSETDSEDLVIFLKKVWYSSRLFLKIVIDDNLDYSYATVIHVMFPTIPMFVSACNDAGATVGNPTRVDSRSDEKVALDLIAKGRWLANKLMVDPLMWNVRCQMQSHVLWWGNQRGR